MSRLLQIMLPPTALLILLGLGFEIPDLKHERLTTPAAAAQTAPQAIVARGRIEPHGGVVAISGPPESMSTVAIVDKLLVEQGSKVVPGQILAVIHGYELSRADFEVAQANLKVARLQRSQLQAGVGKAAEIAAQQNVLGAREALLVKAGKDWERANLLVQKNVASTQVLDTQKAALDQVTQEVEQTRNTIKALSEVRPVDDALAAGQVAVAEANVERARAAMERLQIRARQPGTVLSIQTRSGEIVAGDGIMRVGDLDKLTVIAEVDQGQVGKVKLGMPASIEGSLLSGPVAGRVTRVANETFRQRRPSSDILVGRDARIVEVEVTPEQDLPAVIGAEVTVRFSVSPGS